MTTNRLLVVIIRLIVALCRFETAQRQGEAFRAARILEAECERAEAFASDVHDG